MQTSPSVYRKSLRDARIVIIGAGASGIAAATKLLKAGAKNVVLLESENRIGGRIHTVPFASNVIDLGAQWCHGEKKNVVYETVRNSSKLNLLESTGNIYDNYKCIRSNKEILDETLAVQLKTIAFNSYSQRQDELAEYEGSLGSYLTEIYWNAVENLDTPIDRVKAKEFFEYFKKFESSIEASDHLFEVSGKGHLEYLLCEGDLLLNWKDKGYRSFLNLLMEVPVESESWGVLKKRIFLSHKVENIYWQQAKGIKIRCSSGQIMTADHVICTVSLGVLKNCHEKMFTPNLPLSKVRAIEGLKLGTVDKFFLNFEKPFGPEDWCGMVFLWMEEDLKELRESKYFWLESVFGFYRVSYQPTLLQGWIIGPHARYMETLDDDDVLKALLWLFRKFFTFPIPKPVDFRRTQWYGNNSFYGSYTFRSMYTDELRTGPCDLAAPLTDAQGNLRLQFAGESTHDHFYSTVHGAVETGWREAQRLINFYEHVPARL